MRPNLSVEKIAGALAVLGTTVVMAACGGESKPAVNANEVSPAGEKAAGDGHCGAGKEHKAGEATCAGKGSASCGASKGSASCGAAKAGGDKPADPPKAATDTKPADTKPADAKPTTAPATTTTTTPPKPGAPPAAGKKGGASSCGAGTCAAKK